AVIQHLFWPGKRWFGIDTPFGLLQRSDIGAKLAGVAQFLDRAEELELAGVGGLFEIVQKQSTKPTREQAHGEKETRSAGNPRVGPSGDSPPPGTTQWRWGW